MNVNIEKLLGECQSLDDYKIVTRKKESYELFFVHASLETVRSTDTEEVFVTVYVDHDGKRGSSAFTVYASTTEDEARAKIAAAVEKSRHVNNEPYALPEGEELDGVIESNFSDYEPCELARKIADAVYAADMLECGSINALEVFVNKHVTTVKNSRGIDKRELFYSAMAEAIPTWTDGESVELYECKRMSSFDEMDITEEIAQKMREVRDRSHAQKPDKAISCRVVLDADELSSLFSDIVYSLEYSSVYTQSNFYSIGDAVQKEPTGDKISITLRGAIPGSVASALFDDDGVTLVDTEIVKDGKAVDYWGGNRFAHYLGRRATGNLSCMDVAPGTLTDEELASAPYFRCVSMSGLQVDLYNDYIGGEVRLAYYFDGEKTVALSGISISGSLSAALSSLRLAKDTVTTGRYRGPRYASFDGIEIM